MFESLKEAKENAKRKALEYVIWAETNLVGKTGAEKKAAVIKKLDDMIALPGWLEWLDDILISLFVDKLCTVLNYLTSKDFAGLLLTKQEAETIVQVADSNPDAASTVQGTTISDKIASLAGSAVEKALKK